MERYFRTILLDWRQDYFLEPTVLLVCIIAYIVLLIKRCNSTFASNLKSYLLALALTFIISNFTFAGIKIYKIQFINFIRIVEATNLVFYFVELNFVYSVLSIDVPSRILKTLRVLFSLIFLVIAAIGVSKAAGMGNYFDIIATSELMASLNYIFMLPGFYLYYRLIMKHDIEVETTYPLVFMLFAYTVYSLLIFAFTAGIAAIRQIFKYQLILAIHYVWIIAIVFVAVYRCLSPFQPPMPDLKDTQSDF